jgi:hypothetical protein
MKLFTCPNCGQPLYFETAACASCGIRLGYSTEHNAFLAVYPDDGRWRTRGASGDEQQLCQNAEHDACNWLVPAGDDDAFCLACRHNRTIPDLSREDNLVHWRKIEHAKHRLFYTLLRLRLPLVTRRDSEHGLAFDFLASTGSAAERVMTGHDSGLITLNVAEADDVERERQRHVMHEPYRTLLGHFRHEIAHYYWDRLVVGNDAIEPFRALFGDERVDYGEALKRHYAEGPPPDWPERFITSYASAHPWEDWAETWAHYFHMVDTLETAAEFGVGLQPTRPTGTDLSTVVDFDPHRADIDRIIDAWLPLTFGLNSLNRSMGLADLYPFQLAPAVIWKLAFIHDRIRGQATATAGDDPHAALRAVIAGLKRSINSPPLAG